MWGHIRMELRGYLIDMARKEAPRGKLWQEEGNQDSDIAKLSSAAMAAHMRQIQWLTVTLTTYNVLI